MKYISDSLLPNYLEKGNGITRIIAIAGQFFEERVLQ